MAIWFKLLAVLVLSLGVAAAVAAQESPSFEVVSIKPNVSGEPGRGGDPSIITRRGDTFVATNISLLRLVQWAYPLAGRPRPDDRVSGAPAWVRRQHFDVEAKIAGSILPPYEQLSVLVQSLLAQRFRLVVGHRLVERDAYALRLVGDDARVGGALLRRSADECAGVSRSSPAYSAATLRDWAARLRALESVLPGMQYLADCVTMTHLARALGGFLNADVFDETELDGQWWSLGLAYAHDGVGAPTLFVAVEEQLGLKLEEMRGDVDVLVIEEVHPLIEN